MPKHRSKGRFNSHYLTKDIYKYYLEQTGTRAVSYKVFSAFLKDLNNEIIEYITSTPDTVKLSCNCGTLSVQKIKLDFVNKNNLRIDWKKSKELGRRIYHLNEDRHNYRYSFIWDKGRIQNVKSYKFIITRGHARALAKKLKSDPSLDFPVRFNYKKIARPKTTSNDR